MDRLDGPTEVRATPHGLEGCYWPVGGGGPTWVLWPKPATLEWRTVLDLPATLAPGLTVAEFILLFDIEDRTVDETLFATCLSMPQSGFYRWTKALREREGGPVADFLELYELEVPVRMSPDKRLWLGAGIPHARIVGRGKVDHEFFADWDLWHWLPGSFSLCDIATLPLQVEPFQSVGGVEVTAEFTLRQLIQGVFHWSAPCNFSEELEPWDRERLHFPEFSPGVGSLEESVGLTPDGAGDQPTGP
jgi:hypothetical protein